MARDYDRDYDPADDDTWDRYRELDAAWLNREQRRAAVVARIDAQQAADYEQMESK